METVEDQGLAAAQGLRGRSFLPSGSCDLCSGSLPLAEDGSSLCHCSLNEDGSSLGLYACIHPCTEEEDDERIPSIILYLIDLGG